MSHLQPNPDALALQDAATKDDRGPSSTRDVLAPISKVEDDFVSANPSFLEFTNGFFLANLQ